MGGRPHTDIQPATFSFKAGKLESPGAFDVIAYDGLLLLKWNPVVDAVKYDIYRYDKVDKVSVKLNPTVNGNSATNIYYLDFVRWDNQLVDGRDYEYTVVAVSSQSTSQNEVTTSLPVQNGSSKKSQKARVPATFAPNLSNITYESQGDKRDKILVKIPNQPNLEYTVAYKFGKNAEIVRKFNDGTPESAIGRWYDPFKIARFFAIGGDNTIEVTADFGGNNGVQDQYHYYTDSVSEYISTGALSLESGVSVSNFAAVRANDADPIVNLTWETTGGETFTIYKAEINKAAYTANSPTANDKVGIPTSGTNLKYTVISDWAEVTNLTDPKPNYFGVWSADETVTSIDGYWLYAIVAEDASGGKSEPQFDSIAPASVTVPFNFTVAHEGGDQSKALITWKGGLLYNNNNIGTGTPGVTYELHRATVDSYTNLTAGSATFSGESAWEGPITFAITEGWAVARGTLAPNTKYVYRLKVTKGGISSESFRGITGPTEAQFTAFDIAAQGNDADKVDEYTTNKPANSISLVLVFDNNQATTASYDITLLRRLYTSATVTEDTYDTVALGTANKFTGAEWYFNDVIPAAAGGVYDKYMYKIKLSNGQEFELPSVTHSSNTPHQPGTPGDGIATLGTYNLLTSFNVSSTQYNGTNAPVDISASLATTPPKLPAWSKIITSGKVTTGATVANGTPDSWVGPNILGLKSDIKYTAKTGTPAADKDDIDGAVEVFVVTATITPPAPNTAGDPVVVEYFYYITLPLSATTTPDGTGTAKIGTTTWFTY